MSRFVRLPSLNGGEALVDPDAVGAIAPDANPGNSYLYVAGATLVVNKPANEVAVLLGLDTANSARIEGDHEKLHSLLITRAEAVLDSWKVGGEKLYEAIMDLDLEVATQKGAMYK